MSVVIGDKKTEFSKIDFLPLDPSRNLFGPLRVTTWAATGAAKGVAKREEVDAKPCSDRGLGTGDRGRKVRDEEQQ